MNRRTFLAAGASASLLGLGGCSTSITGGNNTTPTATPADTPTPSNEVHEAKPLAKAFLKRIRGEYENASLSISKKGMLVLEFNSRAESGDGLKAEFKRIAGLYADVVKQGDHKPTTLLMVVGPVQGIVPEPTVRAYANGKIKRKGVLKTMEVTDVDRKRTRTTTSA